MPQAFRYPGRIKIYAHILGWAIFFFLPLVLSPGREVAAYFSDPVIFLSLVLRNIVLAGLFYINLNYLAPQLFSSQNQLKLFLVLVALTIGVGCINFFLHEFLSSTAEFNRPVNGGPGRFGPPPPSGGPGPRPPRRLMLASPFFASILIASLVSAASTLIVLWDNWLKVKAEEQERNLQKVAAELSILKLQVSPHFLFNTLNNIRWLVRTKSDQAEPALVKLSHLLRYILYQTNDERVSLEKEIEHLKDYINLQQMRLADKDAIVIEIIIEPGDKVIVPLLLIPVVENFFKHGDFSQQNTGTILVNLEGDKLVMKTVNKSLVKPEGKDLQHTGIGLNNIKKRLELHYPGKHTLLHEEKNGFFFFTLIIDLK